VNEKQILEQLFLARLTELDNRLDQFPRLKYAMVHHRNIRGDHMQFHDKPYLLDIYKDNAPEIILQSSVQTGKSEFLIVSAHSWAERGLQVLYVLPTTELRNLFVANRVDKLYQIVPHYQKMLNTATGTSDARGLKHFGKSGAIFFAGSNSQTTFIEKPIDLVIGDETDRFDQSNYEKADDRMTASPYKLKYEASNPTVDKFGINARYLVSDQREWFVKCKCCNYWQRMDWFKNVVDQTDDNNFRLRDSEWYEGIGRDIFMQCVKCGNPLDRFTFNSQWVSKHPHKLKTHGYLIHQMLSSYVSIEGMWAKFQKGLTDDTAMQVFYNSMLGATFSGKGSKVTDDVLNACKADYLMPATAEKCFMGVDVGKKLHVVVYKLLPGEQLQLVYAGTIREFEELDYLFARFEVITYVIDAMPETRKSIEYAKKHPGRGYVCRYHQGLEEIKKGLKDDEKGSTYGEVSADRTMIMDRVMSFFMQRRMVLPKNAQSLDKGDFYDQLKVPTRVYDGEKNRYDWLGDPDHYFHATVYALLAYIVRGEFKVVGLNPNAVHTKLKVPDHLNEDALFPPGTPEHLKEHYRRIFAEAKHQSTMEQE